MSNHSAVPHTDAVVPRKTSTLVRLFRWARPRPRAALLALAAAGPVALALIFGLVMGAIFVGTHVDGLTLGRVIVAVVGGVFGVETVIALRSRRDVRAPVRAAVNGTLTTLMLAMLGALGVFTMPTSAIAAMAVATATGSFAVRAVAGAFLCVFILVIIAFGIGIVDAWRSVRVSAGEPRPRARIDRRWIPAIAASVILVTALVKLQLPQAG